MKLERVVYSDCRLPLWRLCHSRYVWVPPGMMLYQDSVPRSASLILLGLGFT